MAWFDERWFDTVIINRMGYNKEFKILNVEDDNVKDLFINVALHDVLKIKGLGKFQIETISMQHDRKLLYLNVSKWLDSESIELECWGVK